MPGEMIVIHITGRNALRGSAVPIAVINYDVKPLGIGTYLITARPAKEGYIGLDELRTYLSSASTKAHVALPAPTAKFTFATLEDLGLRRGWFKVVNADPTTMPLRASTIQGILLNIAYLHIVNKIAIRVSKSLGLSRNEANKVLHKILAKSGYNAKPKNLPRHITEKLPKVKLQ